MYTTVSYDNLDTYLAGLAANTQDTPYEIEISPVTEAFLHGGLPASQGTLQYVLQHNSTKYVSLKFEAPAEFTAAYGMFYGCTSLTSIDVSGMTSVIQAGGMFQGCTSLTSVDVSDMTSVTQAGGMFQGCTSLTSIDVSGMTSVIQAVGMFYECTSLTSIDVSGMTSVTYANSMFQGCTSLTSIDVSGMTSVIQADNMFRGCTSLTSVDVSDMTRITDASYMFQGCTSLTSIDVSGMTEVRYTPQMFYGCHSLTSINLPEMSKVINAQNMFRYCTRLTEIHGWSIPPTAEMATCFDGCTALEAIYVPEPSPSESSWRAWDIRKDTANSRSTVTVYNPDGTSNSVSVPSAGTYTMKVTDKVDELLFSPSESISAATIQKMLQTKAPITAKDALDPTRDNFALLAKDRSSARTNVTTDVIEEGNKLPPTSEAVRAAIGGGLPVGSVIAYWGTSDPYGWFICDGRDTSGTVHELSTKHPELYALIGSNILPDLRGEFIRGAGTNSHTGQGSGGNVGEHQDSTELVEDVSYAHDLLISNGDSIVRNVRRDVYEQGNVVTYTVPVRTFRPTNTSANMIIKY